MRWLLLDEVEFIQKGVKAKSRSTVPLSPVAPELLMIEMMAQTGGVLLGAEQNFEQDIIFSKIESAEFFGAFNPGDRIGITASSDQLRPEGAWIDGLIETPAGAAARARFMLVSVGRLNAEKNQSTTFHAEFMNYFNIRGKVRA